MAKLNIITKKIDSLIPYANNARTHTQQQIAIIASSIKEFGFNNPVLVDKANGVIAGHGRIEAAKLLGHTEVPTIELAHLNDAQRRAYILADNRIALDAGWDDELLKIELELLNDSGFDLELTGFSDAEISELLKKTNPEDEIEGKGSLSERFLVPPFSVLDARQGYWQERKRGWLALGIKSELGRGEQGKCLETGIGEKYGREEMNGTSIFDPVLCELAYRWFSPPTGTVVDPFAGGSVRGIVAAKLGRQYVGIELRGEQVAANRAQWESIGRSDENAPAWHTGDSRNIQKYAKGVAADFIFSCPPYADLEVYSNDPADLSTLAYPAFIKEYKTIISKTCGLLQNNRFACFVVGDVRAKNGSYYNFVSDTIAAFLEAGLTLYNEAILVTCIGSLPIRAGKQFAAGRKLGKTHQNILVFLKGDAKLATKACGVIEIDDSLFAGVAGNESLDA